MKLTRTQQSAIEAILADEPANNGKCVWISAVGLAKGWHGVLRIMLEGTTAIHHLPWQRDNRDAAIRDAQWARKEALRTRQLPSVKA